MSCLASARKRSAAIPSTGGWTGTIIVYRSPQESAQSEDFSNTESMLVQMIPSSLVTEAELPMMLLFCKKVQEMADD